MLSKRLERGYEAGMRKVLMVVLAAGLLAGCVGASRWTINRRQRDTLKVKLGMSEEEVKAIMGKPDRLEAGRDDAGKVTEVLLYQTYFTGDSIMFPPKPEDFTPFVFVDGHLEAWGSGPQ